MTAPLDPDTEQRVYDPDFLKLLANPPSAAARRFTPGRRMLATNLYTTGQPTILRRLFSSPKQEIGRYEVTLNLSDQVLSLSVEDDFSIAGDFRQERTFEARLYPSFAELDLDSSTFAPAAALVLKAKQFDDGLYASVELAADAGLGDFTAKEELLARLLHALAADSERTAAAILTAAARLGGHEPQVSTEVAREAEKLQQEF